MRTLLSLLTLCALLSLNGCGSSGTVSEKTFGSGCWQVKDTITLNFTNEDPATVHSIHFPLAFKTDYAYSNLYIKFLLRTPGGQVTALPYQFQLMDQVGAWNGEPDGEAISFNLNLGDPVRFTEKGTYRLQLVHNMRDDLLCGVTSAGIAVK